MFCSNDSWELQWCVGFLFSAAKLAKVWLYFLYGVGAA
jgi:hypothetical protein